jgi:hypothetical protein
LESTTHAAVQALFLCIFGIQRFPIKRWQLLFQ